MATTRPRPGGNEIIHNFLNVASACADCQPRSASASGGRAHCFNNGGSFDNGLNFTLTMGCGSWGKNRISENLSHKHFINVTHLVRTCPPREPSASELFGAYLARYVTS